MPCSDICIYFTLTLGSKVSDKIGSRATIMISLFLKNLAYAIIYLIPNYYMVLIAMCILGLGGGIGNLAYIKNGWKYFPESQGLVNGIILGGGGISSSILTPLADFFIINPEKEKTDEEGIYPKYIADRVPKFTLIILIIFFPYEESDEEKDSKDNKDNNNNKKNGSLKEDLCSMKNLMMVSFCFCGFCKYNFKWYKYYTFLVFDFLISNCNRDFGNKNGVSPEAIYYLGILFGIVNGASRFMWGGLMDKFGFQVLMFAITLIEIIISTSLYFAVNNSIIYVIYVLIVSSCIGGHFAIVSPEFNKIFGMDVGPELYGLTGNFIGLASLLGPLMTNFILKKKKDFLVVFLISGGLCMIKLFVTLIFDETEKFVYKERLSNLLEEGNNIKDNEKNEKIIEEDE